MLLLPPLPLPRLLWRLRRLRLRLLRVWLRGRLRGRGRRRRRLGSAHHELDAALDSLGAEAQRPQVGITQLATVREPPNACPETVDRRQPPRSIARLGGAPHLAKERAQLPRRGGAEARPLVARAAAAEREHHRGRGRRQRPTNRASPRPPGPGMLGLGASHEAQSGTGASANVDRTERRQARPHGACSADIRAHSRQRALAANLARRTNARGRDRRSRQCRLR